MKNLAKLKKTNNANNPGILAGQIHFSQVATQTQIPNGKNPKSILNKYNGHWTMNEQMDKYIDKIDKYNNCLNYATGNLEFLPFSV